MTTPPTEMTAEEVEQRIEVMREVVCECEDCHDKRFLLKQLDAAKAKYADLEADGAEILDMNRQNNNRIERLSKELAAAKEHHVSIIEDKYKEYVALKDKLALADNLAGDACGMSQAIGDFLDERHHPTTGLQRMRVAFEKFGFTLAAYLDGGGK